MLTREQIDRHLDVDVETGIITWRFHHQRPDLIGRRAGDNTSGYRRFTLCGLTVYAYQIVWFTHYGKWPTTTIDHEDKNTLNDSIHNLREATRGQNAANSKIRVDNTSGHKGVSRCTTTGRWRASITIDGVSINLGRYDTAEEAHSAWLRAASAAHGPEFVRVA